MVTDEDLRRQLKIPSAEWDADDVEFADAMLDSARVVVRSIADPERVTEAEIEGDTAALDAIDQAVLAYAKLMFANPERLMQRRQGSDNSVSFADSSLAAIGIKEVETILAGHFPMGRASSAWIANDVRFDGSLLGS
jgi:hypothetical protein